MILSASASPCTDAIKDPNCDFMCKTQICTENIDKYESFIDDWINFFDGIWKGVQEYPDDPNLSPCVRYMTEAFDIFPQISQNFIEIFTNLDFTRAFDTIDSFRSFMDQFASATSACEFPRLTAEIQNIFTASGGSAIAVRFVTYGQKIIQLYNQMIDALGQSLYTTAGQYFGEILSLLLSYKI